METSLWISKRPYYTVELEIVEAPRFFLNQCCAVFLTSSFAHYLAHLRDMRVTHATRISSGSRESSGCGDQSQTELLRKLNLHGEMLASHTCTHTCLLPRIYRRLEL